MTETEERDLDVHLLNLFTAKLERVRDKEFGTYTTDKQVEVMAKLSAIRKNIESMEETMKAMAQILLDGGAGTISGDQFKLVLSKRSTTVMDSNKLKAAGVYDVYTKKVHYDLVEYKIR